MKCNNVKGNRLSAICCALFVALSVLLLPNLSLAIVNTNAHWPVEVTLTNRNSIYGTVTGLNLSDGDSIGMFDADGNCHGAGLYRGNYYALTAFMHEEASTTNLADQTIEGFIEDEEVFFKVYQKSTGEEYVVIHSSGNPYHFSDNGLTPLTKIDLVYEDDSGGDDGSGGGDGGDGSGGGDDIVDDAGGGSGSTPMGMWAWNPDGEDSSGLGGPSSGSGSTDSGGSNSGSGFQDSASIEPMGISSAGRSSSGSGSSLGSLTRAAADTKKKDITIQEDESWKDALRNIDNIIDKPFAKGKHAEVARGPAEKAKKGMPLGAKLFLLFVTPALAVVGFGIKMMT